MSKRNKAQRLEVVLEIAKILKRFPTAALGDYFGKEEYINYYDRLYKLKFERNYKILI